LSFIKSELLLSTLESKKVANFDKREGIAENG